MGNTTARTARRNGLNPPPVLALKALGNSMTLNKRQLFELRDECILLTCTAQQTPDFVISRNLFRIAAIDVGIGSEVSDADGCQGGDNSENKPPKSPDLDILDQLFTLWDSKGEDEIDYKSFLTGICPLACEPKDCLSTTLHFALRLNDMNRTWRVNQEKLFGILDAINSTASFVGDRVLSKSELWGVVRTVFRLHPDNGVAEMSHNDVVPRLVMNPLVSKFANGRATTQPLRFATGAPEAEPPTPTQALDRYTPCGPMETPWGPQDNERPPIHSDRRKVRFSSEIEDRRNAFTRSNSSPSVLSGCNSSNQTWTKPKDVNDKTSSQKPNDNTVAGIIRRHARPSSPTDDRLSTTSSALKNTSQELTSTLQHLGDLSAGVNCQDYGVRAMASAVTAEMKTGLYEC